MHPIKEMIEKRKRGITCGIPSYCTANRIVIEAVMEEADRHGDTVLIEATANQVNQFGGYTGMQAADFAGFVYDIADRIGFNKSKIILGGDHLGPLLWHGQTEREAMSKSVDLVKSYVKAGFTKIHLDTSMKLADDSKEEKLKTEVIARRGAVLYRACREAFEERLAEKEDAFKPVYVIGSEVPVPGGSQEAQESVEVTSPEAFEDTINTYKAVFEREGVSEAWEDIVAVVVQPGVEFGDSDICMYDRIKAHALCQAIKKYPDLVFEGHSTDYQTARRLKEMVEDGIGILKVGPALTFALREALFSLSMIEKELIDEVRQSHFIEILETAMLENPANWKQHYHGRDKELELAIKYSFSDRSRYYLGERKVAQAQQKLFSNLEKADIPMNMLYQYMPVQYKRVRDGRIRKDAAALAKDAVTNIIYDYNYAVKENNSYDWR